MIYAPNRNYVWTYTFVEALAQAGLRHVVIAPGSRSTPLTMAFAQHPHIRVYSHIDERGAAFMALGLALAEDAPAAVVCSSGTAAANFFPAIVEAHYAHVPLLVLTADRPHELRDSGANQTVDQVKLYGDHVLWSVDVALPEANPPDVALRNLRSLAARSVALADGMPKGAVHLNFPFRKPLEPTEVAGEGREAEWGSKRQDAKYAKKTLIQEGRGEEAGGDGVQGEDIGTRNGASATPNASAVGAQYIAPLQGIPPRIERGVMMPTDEQVQKLAAMMGEAKRIMIVCGPRCPPMRTQFSDWIANLLILTNAVVLVDPLSGMRYPNHDCGFIGTYDHWLKHVNDWETPDLIIHFGAMPVSQVLDDYLNSLGSVHSITITEDGTWTDFNHRAGLMIQCDSVSLVKSLVNNLKSQGKLDSQVNPWSERFIRVEQAAREAMTDGFTPGQFFDGEAVRIAIDHMYQESSLFIASSLPVRHVDQFVPPRSGARFVYCNRGASGIDGTISSALGVAAAEPDKPTVLIIGDLAFYHDLNALLAAKRNGINNLVIVLLNNNGGQIFRRLPINKPEFEPHFTELFTTPHGMTFEHTAAQFGFSYARADDREAFRLAFTAALASGEPSIVEVVTDAEEDANRRKALMDKVAEAVKAATMVERE